MILTLLGFLGLALLLVLLYMIAAGKPIPPALQVVLLVAVALILVVCVLHSAGCNLGVSVTPHG